MTMFRCKVVLKLTVYKIACTNPICFCAVMLLHFTNKIVDFMTQRYKVDGEVFSITMALLDVCKALTIAKQ